MTDNDNKTELQPHPPADKITWVKLIIGSVIIFAALFMKPFGYEVSNLVYVIAGVLMEPALLQMFRKRK